MAIRRSLATMVLVAGLTLTACTAEVASSGSPDSRSSPQPPAATLQPRLPSASISTLAPIGPTEIARVIRVVDGDTVIIDRGLGKERLRYIGMDTPESVKPGTPVEFMALEASAANAALVDGREVVLEGDVSQRDHFGRLLRYVWLHDGDTWTLVNLELVRDGFAQVATYPPDVRWTDVFRAAQIEAREAGRGLWGPVAPVP